MVKNFNELAKNEIINAIENNFLSLLPYNEKWKRALVYNENDLFYALSDIKSALFNNIGRANIKITDVESKIRDIIYEAENRKIDLLWWTGPNTKPENLGENLERNGFIKLGEAPGMAIEIERINYIKYEDDDFEIYNVNDSNLLEIWGETIGKNFGMSKNETQAYIDYTKNFDKNRTILYLVKYKDDFVATSLLHLAQGVAGIYNVSTDESMRKRGIGTNISKITLLEAKKLGYKIGVLQSSEMSNNLYKKIGFQDYCTFGQYYWGNEY